ncbi:MAG TPA: hypothetical protein VKV40_02560 [Ktedonobacteraceae bacterium]|nr:hypothetical protein [Ktedonobacteraceae bacterium]
MPSHQNEFASLQDTQAWRFAGLVQDRLMNPVDEKEVATPESKTPGSQDWNGGVFTYIAPDGEQIRVGRTRNGIDRGGATWIDLSRDGGKTWQRITAITKDDETAGGKAIASVERPYVYGKMVNGEPWVVLGTCAAEKGTKCWDIHEREVPLAHLERLKRAPVRVALAGNARYAYKDGVPLQAPDGKSVFLGVTRHHIGGSAESAVNADTVLCKLDQRAGLYAVTGLLLPRGARGDIDKTCNRLSCELVFPDGTRFWGCDIRNVEEPNASLKSPLKPGELASWRLGDFDEITSFAVARWHKEATAPEVVSVNAILGRSTQARYPTLRYLGIASLVSSVELAGLATSAQGSRSNGSKEGNDPAVVLTYEKASATGSKSTYQQTISRKYLATALVGRGPELLVGQDPGQARTQQRAPY